MDMSRLPFCIKQRVTRVDALNAPEAASAIVRLFDPLSLDLSPAIEAGIAMGAAVVTKCFGHGFPFCEYQG
jgi:hypothetical protein